MKALNSIAWISAGIGVLLIFIGVIPVVFDKNFLHVTKISTVFQAANSFFLIAIVIFVYLVKCDCKKE